MEQKSAQGPAGGASAVLAARDNQALQGIIGTVAELCAPKDSAHEVALATAIGAGMASVVVETDQDAANAIRWLAENRAGRATFLPLNKLSSSRAGGKTVMTARKDGVLGFAHEMLDYDRASTSPFASHFGHPDRGEPQCRPPVHGRHPLCHPPRRRYRIGWSDGWRVKAQDDIAFGGRIQGASEVEKHTAEVEKFHLMEQTVNEALREARMNQQSIRNKINAMVDDSYATEVREVKAEQKQVGQAHKKAQGVVDGLEANWTNYVKVPKKPFAS